MMWRVSVLFFNCQIIFLYIDRPAFFFIHLSFDEYLNRFQFRALRDNAARHTCVRVFVSTHVFISLR